MPALKIKLNITIICQDCHGEIPAKLEAGEEPGQYHVIIDPVKVGKHECE